MRRPSKTLLDNLEEIAEEQENSESRGTGEFDFTGDILTEVDNDDDDDYPDDEDADEDIEDSEDVDYGYEDHIGKDEEAEDHDALYGGDSAADTLGMSSVQQDRPVVQLDPLAHGAWQPGDAAADMHLSIGDMSQVSNMSLQFPASPRRRTIIGKIGQSAAGGDNSAGSSLDYHLQNNSSASSVRSVQRRSQIIVRTSLTGSTGDSSTEGDRSTGRPSSYRKTFASRRSTRRSSNRSSSSGQASTDSATFSAAVDRLGNAERNSEWENVAAAAAVVAASTQAPAKRTHIQFGQGDHVLVLLTLLNVTNRETDPDLFTVDPVNSSGYPKGEGLTEAERQGPYSFVLCVVRTVHFDEDERYYTVIRMDTMTEQRADPPWMQPVPVPAVPRGVAADLDQPTPLERAMLAAQRTTRSMAEQAAPKPEKKSLYKTWPVRVVQHNLIPFYQKTRARAKQVMQDLMHGNDGYAIGLQCTAINFLVACSLVFLFIEVIGLAFLTADSDYAISMIATIVWAVLVLELFLEILIRPSNYAELIHSDKAFAPSTARHINRFHWVFESLALLLFALSNGCAFTRMSESRETNIWFSLTAGASQSVRGPTMWNAALAHFSLGLTFLRSFGLLRRWKQMWIIHTYKGTDSDSLFIQKLLLAHHTNGKALQRLLNMKKRDEDDTETTVNEDDDSTGKIASADDQQLKNAATIGTALMVINLHRALIFLLFIVTVFPMLRTVGGQYNPLDSKLVDLLQANNVASNSLADCDYLENAVYSWLRIASMAHFPYPIRSGGEDDVFVVWAQLLPIRCDWQSEDGVITTCPNYFDNQESCKVWAETWNTTAGTNPEVATPNYFADILGLRPGELVESERRDSARESGGLFESFFSEDFYVRAIFKYSEPVAMANTSLFLLLLSLLLISLIGLTVMRGDAARLVLGPLRRMLKIVVKYADDPLSQSASSKTTHKGEEEVAKEELGNYETEQLISAIAKIADLLRKCWGVAGAGIISSNLARTQDGQTVVFNPTVAGRRVYALFGFVAINEFSKQLRVLDRDVMRLINDVAKVVHDEVYRWSLGGSGQCNKNLGAAFLMVFRIGDFTEVHDKKKRATDVVFNSQMKKNVEARRRNSSAKRRASSRHLDLGKDGTLSLASLPGIQAFSDRALLGMLKSFAGIHRDKELKAWQNDFRLGAGVGAFKVNVIYGMDAGWAVEGAVGSEYKIDATYLSPHVNMASRMMSACKQYGVTVLLSQAVEELLSRPARSKLRHLDTVYVKGSSVPQRMYTYDARYDGVDFFLFERSPEQADAEADSYTPAIWETDQDLKAMRQHVTDEFMIKFREGVEKYLDGKWKEATELLQDADDLMLQAVIEEGYVDYKADDLGGALFDRGVKNDEISRIRNEFGDGASKNILQYMYRRKFIPPKDWHGVRALMSK